MSKTLFFLTLMVCLPFLTVYGQAVDMAEIKPDGIVVPVVDHTAVVNPDEGQLIFNPMTNTYWFYDGGQWYELSTNRINDADNDTHIDVDDFDNDQIVFTTDSTEYGRIFKNPKGIHVFSLYNDGVQRGNVVLELTVE